MVVMPDRKSRSVVSLVALNVRAAAVSHASKQRVEFVIAAVSSFSEFGTDSAATVDFLPKLRF